MNSNPTFLVIDDSYIDRMVATMMLKNSFSTSHVYEAPGGKEGLEFIVERNFPSLTILLDIKMPKMSGFEFLEQFENLESAFKENVSIIILSSTIDPNDERRAKQNGHVKKLLTKPLSINELKLYL